jgi:hypothetical protein
MRLAPIQCAIIGRSVHENDHTAAQRERIHCQRGFRRDVPTWLFSTALPLSHQHERRHDRNCLTSTLFTAKLSSLDGSHRGLVSSRLTVSQNQKSSGQFASTVQICIVLWMAIKRFNSGKDDDRRRIKVFINDIFLFALIRCETNANEPKGQYESDQGHPIRYIDVSRHPDASNGSISPSSNEIILIGLIDCGSNLQRHRIMVCSKGCILLWNWIQLSDCHLF